MQFLDLPPELVRMILLIAVKARELKRALRLRLVNKVFACEIEQAIFASRLADKVLLRQPCLFWERYIMYRVETDVYEESVFNAIRRVALAVCEENRWDGPGRLERFRACVRALTPLLMGNRIRTSTPQEIFMHRATADLSITLEEGSSWHRHRYPKKDPFHFHLLPAAAYLNMVPLVTRLLDEGSDIFHFLPLFGRPSRAAALQGNAEILHLLLSACQRATSDAMFLPAIEGAMESGHVEALNLAFSHLHNHSQLHRFVYQYTRDLVMPGRNIEVFECARNALSPLCSDVKHLTPQLLSLFLWRAARAGHTQMVAYLTFLGAPINGTATHTHAQQNPLYAACEWADEETVRLLLHFGASPNCLVNTKTPLQIAASRGHLGIVSILLDHGANPNLGSAPGPLASALMLEYRSLALLLLRRGAVISKQDSDWLWDMDVDEQTPFKITTELVNAWLLDVLFEGAIMDFMFSSRNEWSRQI